MEDSISKKIATSGVVHNGPCWLTDILIGTDGVNDPAITIYNAVTAAADAEVVPTATYDASALGLNGASLSIRRRCNVGIYVEITTAGACEVVVGYKPFN